ncbi:MAG: hypothetical protein QOE41_3078, partial [Mycobacterium sp.]|nr:hypothetical protein [Mycobacterium sp.]
MRRREGVSPSDGQWSELGSGSMANRWQLKDRPAEFGAIRPALTDSECCGVFLVGPAGVGKTTLARIVTKSLTATVHWVA